MTQEILIQSLSKKGIGRGTDKTRTVEVRGTLPGEKVVATPFRKKKKVHIYDLETVVAPSSSRVAPRCPHATECGGCAFQFLAYEEQLIFKHKKLQTLFPDETVLPVLPSPQVFAYRNKMEFTFSQDKEGNKYLGLIKGGSKGRVLNLTECHLTPTPFTAIRKTVFAWWEQRELKAYHMFSDTGHLRNLVIRTSHATGEIMVILVVSGNPDYALTKEDLTELKAALPGVHLFVKIHQAIKGKPTQFYEHHLQGSEWLKDQYTVFDTTYNVKISPSAFFQPNSYTVGLLYERAIQLAQPKKTDTVYDLYCGSGTIGMAFSQFVDKVHGIEINPYAVFDAQGNIEANGITNMTVEKGDVAKAIQGRERKDIVLVDPPRAGLEKAVTHLIRMSPEKIVYISCNPQTQAEDLVKLKNAGYGVSAIQPVDQFPHTPHVETILVLTKETNVAV